MTKQIDQFLADPTIRLDQIGPHDLGLISDINQIAKTRTLSLESLERLEELLKSVLTSVLAKPMIGDQARQLAVLMREQGLLLKYKPYAVKASNPFGYSIFLQRQNQGFSFQNHLKHKTEVFHILEVLPGGYVFLCHYADWQLHYEPKTFQKWLDGQPHPFFDSCRYFPKPGDTFVVSELGIVHTVIGCILEEFATISTDMVQRLHDQNDRNQVPMPDREEVFTSISKLRLPRESNKVNLLNDKESREVKINSTRHLFGKSHLLTDTFLKASHFWIDPRKVTELDRDEDRITVIRIFSGTGSIVIQDESEMKTRAATSPVRVHAGDCIVVPPSVFFQVENLADSELTYSEHRIRAAVALV